MYTYRKKIKKSHSATPNISTIDILDLSFAPRYSIADMEVKVTLYDVANEKSSIVYYRKIAVIDPLNVYYAPLVVNDSSFSKAEVGSAYAAYVQAVFYDVVTTSIYITAENDTLSGTLNTTCIIDYKINFY